MSHYNQYIVPHAAALGNGFRHYNQYVVPANMGSLHYNQYIVPPSALGYDPRESRLGYDPRESRLGYDPRESRLGRADDISIRLDQVLGNAALLGETAQYGPWLPGQEPAGFESGQDPLDFSFGLEPPGPQESPVPSWMAPPPAVVPPRVPLPNIITRLRRGTTSPAFPWGPVLVAGGIFVLGSAFFIKWVRS